MPNPSPIQCSQCSEGSSAELLECAKCGGRVVRICGACGFKNSAAKGFCDVCGDEMTAGTPGQAVPAQKIVADKPDNLPSSKTPPPEPPAPPPPEPPPRKEIEPPKPKPAPEPEPPPRLPPVGRQPDAETKPTPSEPPQERPSTPTPAEPHPRRSLEDFIPRTGVQRILRDKEPEKKPPKESLDLKSAESGGSASSEKAKPLPEEPPKTVMRRIAEPKKEDKAKSAPKPEPKSEPKPAPELRKAPPPEKRFERKEPAPRDVRKHKPLPKDELAFTQRTIRRVKQRPVASTISVVLMLAVSAGLYGLLWKQRNTPSRLLMKAAGGYLFALKEKNFGAAYEALSSASKRSLSSDRFTEIQEKGDWSFDDLEIKSLTEKWGFITYKLYGANASGDDWMHFVLENGEWKRAYWWHHMPAIEDALEKRDFQTALKTANAAAKINPRDPLVNSYLCEAAYGLQRWETAVKVCLRTFQAANKFPSRLEPKDLFSLHTLMADIYRHRLGKPDAALAEYNIMLAFPLLDADNRCDILLARGDTFLTGKNYQKALSDYEESAKHCRNSHDQAYAEHNARVLSGEAGEEAVDRLKNHTMPGDSNTLLEWRKKVRANLARELKTAVDDLAVKETWTAEHVQGPVYKVTVTDRSTPILSGEVDLLDRSIKVNIHVQ